MQLQTMNRPAAQDEREVSFWRLLPQAFVYPLRGKGKWMILGGAAALCAVASAGPTEFCGGAR